MRNPSLMPAVLAALVLGASAVSSAAPEVHTRAPAAVSSRPRPQGSPAPAPRTRPQGRLDPMAPPASWRALEGSSSAAPVLPHASARVPAAPVPLPPPPPPLRLPSPPLLTPSGNAAKSATEPQAPPQPVVQYLGMASGPGGSYAILRVDGRLHVMASGASAGRIRVLEITPSHAVLRVDGKRKQVRITAQPGGRPWP